MLPLQSDSPIFPRIIFTKSIVTCLYALGLAMAVACSPFEATTPPTFVSLDTSSTDYRYRATSADGLVLAARVEDNKAEGELSFWERAVENEVRDRGGYALLEKRNVRSRDGTLGRQLRFGHDENAKPSLYYVTVFVSDQSGFLKRKHRIFVLEAGGSRDLMEKNAKAVEGFVADFRINRAKPLKLRSGVTPPPAATEQSAPTSAPAAGPEAAPATSAASTSSATKQDLKKAPLSSPTPSSSAGPAPATSAHSR